MGGASKLSPRRVARQLDAAFAARSDVMGYSEFVFFRFAAVSFFSRSLLRNERAFFGKMIPTRSWAGPADPASLRRGFVCYHE